MGVRSSKSDTVLPENVEVSDEHDTEQNHGGTDVPDRWVRLKGTGARAIEIRAVSDGTPLSDPSLVDETVVPEKRRRRLGAPIPGVVEEAPPATSSNGGSSTAWISSPVAGGGDLICRFCGGKSCKHEDWTLQKTTPAIRGLNSSWITKDILATQRMSSRIIREFDIIEQFKTQHIQAVFNLQMPGEHTLCGDGIHADSGFSYRPEEFMDQGIFFYNFGWQDMDIPTLDLMMNLVQVISFTLHRHRKKVAVHCHAGYGRTGLAIGCWVVYSFAVPAAEAINLVRSRRPGSIQTQRQVQYMYAFEEYVNRLRQVFVLPPIVRDEMFTLQEFLIRQRRYLHGEEARHAKHVPKIVSSLCSFLEKGAVSAGETLVATAFIDVGDWAQPQEEDLRRLKQRTNNDDWYGLDRCDLRYQAQLLLDWLDTLKAPLIPSEVTQKALNDPDNVAVEDFQATPLHNMATLNVIVKMLRSLQLVDPSVLSRLHMRFAYALMHPVIPLPDPLPFRTMRVVQIDGGSDEQPRSSVGQVNIAKFSARFQTPRVPVSANETLTGQDREPTSSISANSAAAAGLTSAAAAKLQLARAAGVNEETKETRSPSTDFSTATRSGTGMHQLSPRKRFSLYSRNGAITAPPHSPNVAPPVSGEQRVFEYRFAPLDVQTPHGGTPYHSPRKHAKHATVGSPMHVTATAGAEHTRRTFTDSWATFRLPARAKSPTLDVPWPRTSLLAEAAEMQATAEPHTAPAVQNSDGGHTTEAVNEPTVAGRPRSALGERELTRFATAPGVGAPGASMTAAMKINVESQTLLDSLTERQLHQTPLSSAGTGVDPPDRKAEEVATDMSGDPRTAPAMHSPASAGQVLDQSTGGTILPPLKLRGIGGLPQHSGMTENNENGDDVSLNSQLDEEEATFQSLVLLGEYVGLLVKHWSEFAEQAAHTLAQTSVGVAGREHGSVDRNRGGDHGFAFRSVQARDNRLDEFRRTDHSRDNSHGSDWDKRVAERVSELFGTMQASQQTALLHTLLLDFESSRHVRGSSVLMGQLRAMRTRTDARTNGTSTGLPPSHSGTTQYEAFRTPVDSTALPKDGFATPTGTPRRNRNRPPQVSTGKRPIDDDFE